MAILLLLLGMCGGCTDAPAIAEVTGRVTRGGQPVPNVTLHFIPEDGRPSWATTDANGEFEVEYDPEYKGALVGKHKVFVQFRQSIEDERAQMTGQRPTSKPHPEKRQIVEKYGNMETSPLEIEITEDGQVLDIKLD